MTRNLTEKRGWSNGRGAEQGKGRRGSSIEVCLRLGIDEGYGFLKMKLKFIFNKRRFMEARRLKELAPGGRLKATRQREEILNIFLNSPGHKNIAQLYALVAKVQS